MLAPNPSAPALHPVRVLPAGPSARRAALLLCTLASLAVAGVVGATAAVPSVEPELVRLLRAMAALKGLFAAVAFVGCYWRLGRPAAWRTSVYALGPGLMAGATVCLWSIQATGSAAVILHVALFGLLAAALTDRDFIPGFPGALRGRRVLPR